MRAVVDDGVDAVSAIDRRIGLAVGGVLVGRPGVLRGHDQALAVRVIGDGVDLACRQSAVEAGPGAARILRVGAGIDAAVAALQQPAGRVEGKDAGIGMGGRAVRGAGADDRLDRARSVGPQGDAKGREGEGRHADGVAGDIEDVGIGLVDGERQVGRGLAARIDRRHGQRFPRCACILRQEKPDRLAGGLDIGGLVENRESYRAARSGGQPRHFVGGDAAHQRPGRAADVAPVDAALRRIGGADGGIEDVVVGRIGGQGRYRAGGETGHQLEARAAVVAAIEPACGAVVVRVAGGGQHRVAARGDAHDVLAAEIGAAQLAPARAAVGAVENAGQLAAAIVADAAVRGDADAGHQRLARGVGRIERQAADRQGSLLVRQRRPRDACVARHPDTAVDGAGIDRGGIDRIRRQRLDAARHRAVGRCVVALDGGERPDAGRRPLWDESLREGCERRNA